MSLRCSTSGFCWSRMFAADGVFGAGLRLDLQHSMLMWVMEVDLGFNYGLAHLDFSTMSEHSLNDYFDDLLGG